MPTFGDLAMWSADVEEATLDKALKIPDLPLEWIKLDRVGLMRMGTRKICTVQNQGYRVFADAKIIEVPSKVMEIANEYLLYRPDMLNIMAGATSTGLMDSETAMDKMDALKRFADGCHAVGTLPCAVTVLTSKDPKHAQDEYGGQRTSVDQVLWYVEQLFLAGFTDIVCSPHEAAAIRREPAYNNMQINCPGVRLPGSDTRDQARVMTPLEALQSGANRVVIGQDLTKGDLVQNCERLALHLAPLLGGR